MCDGEEVHEHTHLLPALFHVFLKIESSVFSHRSQISFNEMWPVTSMYLWEILVMIAVAENMAEEYDWGKVGKFTAK